MVRHASIKDILREIKKTFSRFVSIILLLVISVAFFSGLRVTKPDMRITVDHYMDEHNIYDIRVQSTLGLTEDDIEAISNIAGVHEAIGSYQFDAIAASPTEDIVISVQTLSTAGMNSPELIAGSMPEHDNECVTEESFLSMMGLEIGDTFDFKEVSDTFKDALSTKTFKIVGMVRSPLYIAKVQRGSSALGSGTVSAYVMIPPSSVNLAYYTEADITVSEALVETAYTDAYKNAVQPVFDRIKELETTRAQIRYNDVVAQATGELNDAQAELNVKKTELADAVKELDAQQAALDAGYAALNAQKAALDAAQEQINENRAALKDAQEKIAEGEEKLKDAEAKIEGIEECVWYIADRSSNIGYDNYGQDADRMGALGNVFPIIFFAVAALVCLTTMTRMVDEKRIEIGTYKALGHSSITTAGKFIFYSLSATIIGVLGGLISGTLFFPQFIFKAYSIMYELPPIETPQQLSISIISVAVAIVCTVGATLFACFKTLRETPASLLRPKAPEPGKRVILEYITPLWNRMSFFSKVSARNIFRYKKRLIMTLVGIAGCTALIVTGFGLRDSIADITEKQFNMIFKYDLQVYLSENPSQNEVDAVLKSAQGVSGYILELSTAADFSSSAGTETAHIVVPENPQAFVDFVQLAHRSDGSIVNLPDDGAVITEKLAERLDLKVGDAFTIDADGKQTAVVSDIVENYVYHYVYLSPVYYESVFGKTFTTNQILVKLNDDTEETADEVSAQLLKLSDVGYVSHFKAIAKGFADSMNSVNYVVIIILVSAALLALVVLYNLTNINITERFRELATIKVLGFYDKEVSWYIFRENTILTTIGIFIGLLGGKYLHSWLVKTVELNFVMFGREAKPLSYLFAALLTGIFAVVVNILGHRHMKRINMVESLKTNE